MTVTVKRGILAILSGPSGVGKSSVIRTLLEDDRFALSVSATTRPPRPGERDGIDYHFLDETEFRRRIAAGDFLEYAEVHGVHLYGTLRSEVERLRDGGRIVILDIDVQGARTLEDEEATSVFVAPPSFEDLERRLAGRRTETPESIRRRLETAREEMKERDRYDHVVVNDDLTATVERIKRLLLDEVRRETERPRHGAP